MQTFCKAFLKRDSDEIQKQLTRILNNMISILDTKARNEEKEIFYHGLLLGLLRSESDWLILSNAESGDGFSDILIEPEDPDMGIVIELMWKPNDILILFFMHDDLQSDYFAPAWSPPPEGSFPLTLHSSHIFS